MVRGGQNAPLYFGGQVGDFFAVLRVHPSSDPLR